MRKREAARLAWWPIRLDPIACMQDGLLLLAEAITEDGEQTRRWQVTAPRILPFCGFEARLEDARSRAKSAAREYAGQAPADQTGAITRRKPSSSM